jgi:hypothetical protein
MATVGSNGSNERGKAMTAPATADSTSLKSTFYEQLVELEFISEVLQEIWYSFGMIRQENSETWQMSLSYRFFGNQPGKRLPSLEAFKIAKHAKANAQGRKLQRDNIRVVPRTKFVFIQTTRELLERLFDLRSDSPRVNPNAATGEEAERTFGSAV